MPSQNHIFLDVEASSLKNGFPLEVAWCSADVLRGASYLIRPEPGWLDRYHWSTEAESIHGLSLDRLRAEGLAAAEVMARLCEDLRDCRVHSDNPRFDGGWLRLLRDPPPFDLTAVRPPGAAALSATSSGLRAHRALDDAVALAMAHASFAESDQDRLDAEEALARGRALVARCGRP